MKKSRKLRFIWTDVRWEAVGAGLTWQAVGAGGTGQTVGAGGKGQDNRNAVTPGLM